MLGLPASHYWEEMAKVGKVATAAPSSIGSPLDVIVFSGQALKLQRSGCFDDDKVCMVSRRGALVMVIRCVTPLFLCLQLMLGREALTHALLETVRTLLEQQGPEPEAEEKPAISGRLASEPSITLSVITGTGGEGQQKQQEGRERPPEEAKPLLLFPIRSCRLRTGHYIRGGMAASQAAAAAATAAAATAVETSSEEEEELEEPSENDTYHEFTPRKK